MNDPASTSFASLSSSLAAAAERAAASLVPVRGGRWPATGIAYAPDLVLTTAHAVDGREAPEVRLGAERRPATLVGRDAALDVALLRVPDAGLAPLTWRPSTDARVGELLLGVARPRGAIRARLGLLSAKGPGYLTPWGARVDADLEVDLSPRPGLAGAVVLDAEGRALGMIAAGGRRQQRRLLPAETLGRVVQALLAHGRVRRGYLGVGTQPVRLPQSLRDTAGQSSGLLVLSLEAGSPADAAGLTLGDVLVAVHGRSVEDLGDLLAALGEDAVGRSVTLRILRGGRAEERTLTVGVRP